MKFILLIIAVIGLQSASGQNLNNTIDSSLQTRLVEGRTFFDGLGKSYPVAGSVEIKPEMINNVSCYWFNPKQSLANRLIIYLHGGGFAWGSIRSHQALVSHIAEQTSTTILFVEYALAPENSYPKGVSDLITVYKHMVGQHPSTDIFLIGDSAGGGLIVSAIRQLQHDNLRQPQGVVMISPWLNLNADTPSYTNNASLDPILTTQAVKEYAEAYNPCSFPEASPSSITFTNFPPVLVFVGTHEILLDDSQIFYDAIRKIQPGTTLKIFPGQTHVWMLATINHPDSKGALMEIKAFMKKTGNDKAR